MFVHDGAAVLAEEALGDLGIRVLCVRAAEEVERLLVAEVG